MGTGDCIFTLLDLFQAVKEKKAVVVPALWLWRKPHPAAFVINLSGIIILDMINKGMFIYKKEVE